MGISAFNARRRATKLAAANAALAAGLAHGDDVADAVAAVETAKAIAGGDTDAPRNPAGVRASAGAGVACGREAAALERASRAMSGPRGGSHPDPRPTVDYPRPRYASIRTVRRYYLRKAQENELRREEGLAAAYRGKLAQVAGTPLPVGFPLLAELEAAHYTCWEDLDGCSPSELMQWVRGIRNLRDAELVLAAWRALTPVTLPEIQTTSG